MGARRAANREAQAREQEGGTGAFTAAAGGARSGAEAWGIVSDLVGPVPPAKEGCAPEGRAYQASLIARLKHLGGPTGGAAPRAESPAPAPAATEPALSEPSLVLGAED